MNPLEVCLAVITGYALGSLSFANLLSHDPGEADYLHRHGAGASTTFWLHGLKAAFAVLLCDIGKGAVAMLIAQSFIGDGAAILAGIAAVAGHNWPLFHHFKGGRGVATAAGTLLPLIPLALGVGIAAAVTVFLLTRNILLASLTLYGATLALAWKLDVEASLLIYALALSGAVAAYTMVAGRHEHVGERWRSTTLKP
ncbi:MAG: glycerol-3-phosphate acyltransferase [Chloroflexi bacterium]|nr:glycerol-3-phosphate acyltransferase [Chloroflexota bacterium]